MSRDVTLRRSQLRQPSFLQARQLELRSLSKVPTREMQHQSDENFPAGFTGARVPRRIKSRARGTKMARVRRSWTRTRTHQATLRTAIPATSQTTTTIGIRKMLR